MRLKVVNHSNRMINEAKVICMKTISVEIRIIP